MVGPTIYVRGGSTIYGTPGVPNNFPFLLANIGEKKIISQYWFKYEINFLIYTLSFLVIYLSNCHFYKHSAFSKKHFLTVFTKHLVFWKNTFSLCTFWKFNFFKKLNFKKLNQTQQLRSSKTQLPHVTIISSSTTPLFLYLFISFPFLILFILIFSMTFPRLLFFFF